VASSDRSEPRRNRDRRNGAHVDDDIRERIRTRLAGAEQRVTRGRVALLDVLVAADRPLTIPEIGELAPGLAVSSIYRNLTGLEEIGVVRRIVTTGEFAHYELAEDLTDHHHHHLVCSNCGAVEDFETSTSLETAVRDLARKVGRKTGFRADQHLLDLVGLCGNCA
jgi:Fe2+ or Zn2+ uptake regulation protein